MVEEKLNEKQKGQEINSSTSPKKTGNILLKILDAILIGIFGGYFINCGINMVFYIFTGGVTGAPTKYPSPFSHVAIIPYYYPIPFTILLVYSLVRQDSLDEIKEDKISEFLFFFSIILSTLTFYFICFVVYG